MQILREKLRRMHGGQPDEGLYESVVTTALQQYLDQRREMHPRFAAVDVADQPHVLTRHLLQHVEAALLAGNPQQQVDLANALLELVGAADATVAAPVQQLLRLDAARPLGVVSYPESRPATPLSDVALLTNAAHEPSLSAEIRAELDSADDAFLLCAFIKWHGLRLLEKELQRRADRGVGLKVITTTYMGATERSALDRLVRDFGAEIKVQYDIRRTRLHAKAWLFRRLTGFDTAYVGSSNLSRSALLDGLEWNVRLSRVVTPQLIDQFAAVFDTYWNDPSYEHYDPDRDAERLDQALAEAGGRRASTGMTLAGLEVRPYPYQEEMLEALQVERIVHDRHQNLLVAATGTGKTVVAALDYKQLLEGRPPLSLSLLFVAHRKEILDNARRVYREVLADGSFGEMYVQGQVPRTWKHVFASIQSLSAAGPGNLEPDAFDVVVIDEFHHANARTYRELVDRLEPRELLGLTATPERGDGFDVREIFGGRTAAELRLWDALEADLLCPFHYFGVADETDLSAIEWKRGRYDETQLAGLYTGNDARARIVLRAVKEKLADPRSMRALGFCVGVDHARYMARVFTDAGLPARAVTGSTPPDEREQALKDLRAGELTTLFSADLYNEGVDIPSVDTVLFLRPTESATVFLQQLGRGLRHADGKAVLTALDFVGNHRKEFRFDQRFTAITGIPRSRLQREVERDFPFLPSGTQVILDEQTKDRVLANLKQQLAPRRDRIVQELCVMGDVSLPAFLEATGLRLSDVLDVGRADRSWTRLRRAAGLPTSGGGPREGEVLRRARAMTHVDDPDRARAYCALLEDDAPVYDDLSVEDQDWARMLFFSLWPDGGGFADYRDGLEALRQEAAGRQELRSVIDLGLASARHVTRRVGGRLGNLPLRIHATYQREEVLAAINYASFARKPNSFREGVLYSEPIQADAFFVTLQKSEADYSPTTLYRDYAISPTLFHWESQTGTTVASPTGQRYIHHRQRGTEILIFSRQHKRNELGTAPYLFLGTAGYVEHRGEKPIAFTWRLDVPMPPDDFAAASVVSR